MICIVLHPCHKLEYFKSNDWNRASIEAGHDIAQDKFDWAYWLGLLWSSSVQFGGRFSQTSNLILGPVHKISWTWTWCWENQTLGLVQVLLGSELEPDLKVCSNFSKYGGLNSKVHVRQWLVPSCKSARQLSKVGTQGWTYVIQEGGRQLRDRWKGMNQQGGHLMWAHRDRHVIYTVQEGRQWLRDRPHS